MRRLTLCLLTLALPFSALADHHAKSSEDKDGWVSLFNGEDLTGWKVVENPDTFRVEDGVMIVKGPRAHAFYVGEVADADFKNFVLQLEVKTKPQGNSGVYFHTKMQEEGWPNVGHEAQVNATHGDPRKTGGLYGVKDVMENAPHEDNEWFTYTIEVRGNRVVLKVDDKVTTDYTEPDHWDGIEGRPERKLSSGTFAIQGHDPESEIHFRNIKVKVLPDDLPPYENPQD